jgi:hypothetical protein
MLKPHKHMDLDSSVLRAGAIVLRNVRRRHVADLNTLRQRVFNASGDATDKTFGAALNLLFLLGLIKYHPATDIVEYTGKN